MRQARRPPTSQLIIYSIGQYGWSLASFAAGNLLPIFYLPAEDGTETFPTFFHQGSVWFVFTIIGLVAMGGRLLDAFTDPWIARFSDNMPLSRLGKRKRMMAWAALPFAVSAYLMFHPIEMQSSWLNILWLCGMSVVYYIAFTMYLIPYNALIAELGHHPPDRMKISTYISLAWILGFVTGFSIYSLQGGLEEAGYTPLAAFQTLLLGFSALALLCMWVPVLFLRENEYALQKEPQAGGNQGLAYFLNLVRQDANLRHFVLSDMIYWLSATFVTMGIPYYVTLLMGKEKGESTSFLVIALVVSLLLYWPINLWVGKYGKKRLTMLAFLGYILVFALTGFIDAIPLPMNVLFFLAAILAGFPMASFGILPNAILADLVHLHEMKTGHNESGTYFAVRTFMMKIGITLAVLVFPSLLLLGKSLDNPTGVRATAVVAMCFCALAMWLFRGYKEEVAHR